MVLGTETPIVGSPRLPCAPVTEPATDVPLAPLTTLRLGGPARRLVSAATEEELVGAVREADAAGEPLLVLAGGSNLVIADAGWEGSVVRIATSGVELRGAADGRVEVRAAAGESWDELVARLVAEGLAGVECLAGIPGSTGATPIQNVGAYGQEVATSLAAVRVLDRVTGEIAELAPRDCGLRYRGSIFKYSDRHVVLGGHVRARALRALGADPLRGARSDARRGARSTRPAGRRARSRARAAPWQGHGPRRGRSRHLERRLVLHEPDPRAGGVRGSGRARPGCGRRHVSPSRMGASRRRRRG